MPSGQRVSEETKSKALESYYIGEQTVAEIAYKFGVKPRTVYSWVENMGHGNRFHIIKEPRKALKLSRKEAEAILLMIMECESIVPEKYFYTLKILEDRVLEIADNLPE